MSSRTGLRLASNPAWVSLPELGVGVGDPDVGEGVLAEQVVVAVVPERAEAVVDPEGPPAAGAAGQARALGRQQAERQEEEGHGLKGKKYRNI